MRGLILGLVLLVLGGCQGRVSAPWATPPKVEQGFDAPEPLLDALAQRRDRLLDLKAKARFTLRTPDQELSADHVVVIGGRRSLRMETLSPIGQPTGLLVARDDRIRWVDTAGGRYWDGPASRETLERLIGVPLAPDEIVAILQGGLPPVTDTTKVRLEKDPGEKAYRLVFPAEPMTRRREEVLVARRDLTIRSLTRYDAEGKEVLKVLYGRFRTFRDYPFALRVEVELPQRDLSLTVDYQKVLVNQNVGEGMFELPIPPGSKRITLE